MLALLVALSVLGLAAGPALVALGRGRGLASAAVEGLTLGLVPALLALRLLPHVYEGVGPAALGWAAAGYAALWLADRWEHRAGTRVGLAVVVPAVALHALTDGAALAVAVATRGAGGAMLALALVLHRLPEGLFLASTLRRSMGWRGTLVRIGVVAAATVVGSLAGQALLAHVPETVFDAIVAVGLGAMLRLVLHNHGEPPRTLAARATAGAAFAIGLLVVVLLPTSDNVLTLAQPSELPLGRSFVSLFVETAPALLAGLVVATLVRAAVGVRAANAAPRGPLAAIALRGVRAALAPEPGVCADAAALGPARSSRPAAAFAVASALAAPAFALDGAVLALPLLGWRLTALRAGLGAAMAWLVALAAAHAVPALRAVRPTSRPPRAIPSAPTTEAREAKAPARLREVVAEAIGASVDKVAVWYLVGLVAGAALEAALAPGASARVGPAAAGVLVVLVAAPVAMCAQGSIPVAAVLVHKGFPTGAALAFVLLASGTSAGFVRAVGRAWGGRAGRAVLVATGVLGVGAAWLTDALVGADRVPGFHPMVAHRHAGAEWLCAGVLGALLVASLLRAGPRRWFGAMVSSAA